MAFPAASSGATHTEGGVAYASVETSGGSGVFIWQEAAAAAATAASVTNVAAGNLAATNVQAALDELQGDIDALQSITGQNLGTVATSAALLALADVDGTTAIEDGDFAILSVDEGGREAGVYIASGGAFPATPAYQFPDDIIAASDTAAGIIELATDAEAITGTATNLAITPANLAAAVPTHETDTTLTAAGQILTYTGEDATAVTRDVRTPVVTAFPADNTASNAIIYTGTGGPAVGHYFWNGVNWVQG